MLFIHCSWNSSWVKILLWKSLSTFEFNRTKKSKFNEIKLQTRKKNTAEVFVSLNNNRWNEQIEIIVVLTNSKNFPYFLWLNCTKKPLQIDRNYSLNKINLNIFLLWKNEVKTNDNLWLHFHFTNVLFKERKKIGSNLKMGRREARVFGVVVTFWCMPTRSSKHEHAWY